MATLAANTPLLETRGLRKSFRTRKGDVEAVNFFVLPLQLLSGITLPLTLAPLWIRTAATFNPLSHAVDASRSLFAGSFGDPSILRGFTVLAVTALLAVAWAARAFRNATA